MAPTWPGLGQDVERDLGPCSIEKAGLVGGAVGQCRTVASKYRTANNPRRLAQVSSHFGTLAGLVVVQADPIVMQTAFIVVAVEIHQDSGT